MCLSERSELRHIDPKARIERWDTLACLSKRSELRHIDPKATFERGLSLIALASEVAIHSNKSVLEERFLI